MKDPKKEKNNRKTVGYNRTQQRAGDGGSPVQVRYI